MTARSELWPWSFLIWPFSKVVCNRSEAFYGQRPFWNLWSNVQNGISNSKWNFFVIVFIGSIHQMAQVMMGLSNLKSRVTSFMGVVTNIIFDAGAGHKEKLLVGPDIDGRGLGIWNCKNIHFEAFIFINRQVQAALIIRWPFIDKLSYLPR